MGRAVALAVARRSLLLIPRLLSTFVPSMVMPVFFTIVFSEAFAGIALLPGFPARESVDWFLPMSAMMGSAFAGVTTGMGVARDLEIGFYERFLASPAPRSSLLAGALLAAVARAAFPVTLVLLVGALLGARLPGGVAGLGLLAVAAIGVSLAAASWSLGIALRLKTLQAAPLMQVGVFLTVFLSTAQMPLDLLTGWLKTVATYNPMTYILRLARQGFLTTGISWADTWPGLVGIGVLLAVLTLFAARGMQRVTP